MKKILIAIFAAILIVICFNSKTSAWEIENNQLISSNILNLEYDFCYLIDTTYDDYKTFNNPNIDFIKLTSGQRIENYTFKNKNWVGDGGYTHAFEYYDNYNNYNHNKNIKELYVEGGENMRVAFLFELKKPLKNNSLLQYIFNFYTFDDTLENTYSNDIENLSVLAASFDKNSNEISGIYNYSSGYLYDRFGDNELRNYKTYNKNIFCDNIDSYSYSSGFYKDNDIDYLTNLNEINCIIITISILDEMLLDFNVEIKSTTNNDYYFTPFGIKYNDFNTSQQNQDLIKIFDTNNYFIESDDIQVLNSQDYSILNGYVAIKDKGTKSININYLAPPTIKGSLENLSHVYVFAFKNIGYNSDAGVLSINGSDSRYIDNYVYTFIDLGEYLNDFQLPYTNFNITTTNYSSAKVIFGLLVAPQFFNLTYVPQEQKYHINDSAVKTYLTTLENSFNTDIDSYNNGVNYGYNQGFNDGVNNGYSDGFKIGYEEGSKDGYKNGLNNSGGNAWKNVWDFIYNIFTFIGKFMDIELVAGVKVGYIVTFIITLSLISFLIHVFKG